MYQLRRGDEVIVTDERGIMELADVVPEASGRYFVDAVGPSGTVTSDPAELTVLANVAITGQPSEQTRYVGEEVTFTVSASGDKLTYQWRKDGANLAGQTEASLTVGEATLGDSGVYDVIVGGACGGPVASNQASFTVLERRRSSEAVVRLVREYLRESAHLAQLAEGSVRAEVDEASSSLSYILPGLENPERSARLSPSSGDDAWELADGEADSIQAEVDRLDKLLDEVPPNDDLTEAVREIARTDFSQYVKPDMLTTGPVEADWELTDGGLAWRGTGSVEVSLDSRNERFTLTNIRISAQDGQVSAAFGDRTRAQGEEELRSILFGVQGLALVNWLDGLRLNEEDWPDGTRLDRTPDDGDALRETVKVTLTKRFLVTREFAAHWVPDRLGFEPKVDWGEIFETYWQVSDILQAFNERRESARAVTRVLPPTWNFVEVGTPTPQQTTLTVALPWVPEEEARRPAELNERDRVELPVPIGPVDDVLARLVPPVTWRLLETYSAIRDHPFVVSPDAGEDRTWPNPWNAETLPPSLKGIADLPLRYTAPRLDVSGTPELQSAATPPMLRFLLEGDWALRDAPPGIDRDGLADGVRTLASEQVMAHSLELTATPGQPVAWNWPAEDHSAAAGDLEVAAFEYFDHLLAEFTTRNQIEQVLERQADSEATALSKTDAYELLRDIWDAKLGGAMDGAAETGGSFDALTERLVTQRRFSEISRRIEPTVFIEYFCGPRFTYAIAFSAHQDAGVVEGPYLHRLCRNRVLFEGPAEDNTLGEVLFNRVFESVSQACAATAVVSEAGGFSPFQGNLGIMVAADEGMSLLETSLDELPFTAQETYLKEQDPFGPDLGETVRWNTLRALRDLRDEGKKRCDFRLIHVLSRPTTTWTVVEAREAKRRAALVFEAALTGARGNR